MLCETCPDFLFPLKADVYYAVSDTTAYGTIAKTWVLDKTVVCNVEPASKLNKEDMKAVRSVYEHTELLSGRVKTDIRKSVREIDNAFSNVIVTNIRDVNDNPIYVETSGPRANKSTIYEIAAQTPFLSPFGDVEHFSIVFRRSENQGVDV
jgi:hypothetical protein